MRISDWSSDVCSSDLVSQGRQPCWKLDHRFGRKDILATVVRTGKCGVYFRVIEEGVAQAGTEMRLVERRYPEWTITRLFHLVIGGGERSDMTAVRELRSEERSGGEEGGSKWRSRGSQYK